MNEITILDLFCGAGGSSLGASMMNEGVKVVGAANHWLRAIETHSTNFPDVEHVHADISGSDPRRFPKADALLASPSCTNHSLAKAGQLKGDVLTLWDEAERSRATMWDVPRFAECHRYKWVIVENVVDAVSWTPFPAWLQAMSLLGYEHQIVSHNSAASPPTPQSRDRLYVCFWQRGMRRPDLAIHPEVWCPACEALGRGVQTWRREVPAGKLGRQYDYCCGACGERAELVAWPAASAIDWSIPAQRIGERERPLKPATLARIRTGLERHGFMPSLVRVLHTQTLKVPRPVSEPALTQTARQDMALIIPRGVSVRVGDEVWRNPGEHPGGPEVRLEAEDARQLGILAPGALMVDMRRHAVPRTDAEPLSTVCAGGNHHTVVIPPSVMVGHYNPGTFHRTSSPINTVTAVDHHTLVAPPGFVASYYRTGTTRPVSEPVPTQTTVDRHALVAPSAAAPERPRLEECRVRVLSPEEVQRCMALDTHVDGSPYRILGNKRQRVRQAGNAVTPPVMRELVGRMVAALDEA